MDLEKFLRTLIADMLLEGGLRGLYCPRPPLQILGFRNKDRVETYNLLLSAPSGFENLTTFLISETQKYVALFLICSS